MKRLLLVSNRLPVTVRNEDNKIQIGDSSGGLATGLRRFHEQGDGLWFGWPGEIDGLPSRSRNEVNRELAERRLIPVWLTQSEVRRYYDGMANGVLWPLFHYLLDRIPLRAVDWDSYKRVNERFADAITKEYRPGDLIWVHDFHLLLLPSLLRWRLPDATIGFFLHTPYPSYEVFRLLPWREALLRGMLGADLVGFHTGSYLRHFLTCLLRLLGLEAISGKVHVEGRDVEVRAFPMGVDAGRFRRLADDPAVLAGARSLREEHGTPKILLGIDRLDYTKGLPRRLLAFERLLERKPSIRDKVKLIQIAVPSRLKVAAYGAFRRQVEELVGKINGNYGTPDDTPIHYLFRSFMEEEVVSFYRAADVMLVTPLRDGMNLVAKEYIACRSDEDGVLVLSEFAGASAQLGEALLVNPYDVDGMAEVYEKAILMPLHEQKHRMRHLRERVLRDDVYGWAGSFIDSLARIERVGAGATAWRTSSPERVEEALKRITKAERATFLLDYDGTLVPFTADPLHSSPDEDLLEILDQLSRLDGVDLHIVSGRKKEQIDRWLGGMPFGLHAEHGLWSRWSAGESWRRLVGVEIDWKAEVRAILEEFAERTAGTHVEEKTASLVWHYRQADAEYGALQAKELRLHLLELLSNYPVQILAGDKNVEVRAYGANKGIVATSLQERQIAPSLFVAFGDDRTDEDLFEALPADGIAVHVGPLPSDAAIRVPDPKAARDLLRRMVSLRGREGSRRP